MERPLRVPMEMACFSILPRPSTMSIKRKGDRGSPCLMPHEELKGFEGDPLTKIEKKAKETIFITQFVHSSMKPKYLRIPTKNCQFNLS